jgi:hypothetical protein
MKATYLLVLILLVTPIVLTDNFFYKIVNRASARAAYQLNYISQGSIISGTINLKGRSDSYQLNIYDSAFGSNIIQTISLAGSASFTAKALNATGNYRLEILPQTPSSPMFSFSIVIYIDGLMQGSYSDVARYNLLFVMYLNQAASRTISFQIPSQFLKNGVVSLYGPSDTLGFDFPLAASNIDGNTVSFDNPIRSYYYIVLKVT